MGVHCVSTQPIFRVGVLSLLTVLTSALWISPANLDRDLLSSYNYVIVGGGISGIVVANRLTEDPDITVLVLESGTLDDYQERIMVPKDVADIKLNGANQYYWNYTTVPQVHLDGLERTIEQGRVVGGGSVVNALVWQRGFQSDFDAWAKLGNVGWGWDDLVPYFMKAENYTPPSTENAAAFDIGYNLSLHGTEGPIHISYSEYIYPQSNAMNQALNILGVPTAFDPAAGITPGGSFLPSTIHPTNQSRSDARRGYYDPYIYRSNFHVATSQHVTRIVTRVDTDGNVTISGVEFASSTGAAIKTINATMEVILAAGAIHTAQLLQLSGIGPSKLLESLDINVAINLPGVGQNFQDHWGVSCYYPYGNALYPNPLRLVLDPIYNEVCRAEYYAHRTGPWTSGQLPSTLSFTPLVLFSDKSASILAAATAQSPDEYLANTEPTVLAGFAAMKEIITANLGTTDTGGFEIFHNNAGILIPSILHPYSRGSVEINSKDPFTEPTIDPRYGSNPLDLQIVVEGIKFMQKMINTLPMQKLLPIQLAPPAAATLSDELLTLWVKAGVQTNYHPSGTASMLPLDMGGVVDTNLLVYGTSNLRVVDSGMFPLLPGSHIGAAVYAVAEKASDIIKAAR